MKNTKKLVEASLFLALGFIFPSLFHMLGMGNGKVFLPMHIPVILCGFICGKNYGATVGFLTPVLTSLLTGLPPFYPTGISMGIELCVYGFISGYLYDKTNKIYLSLIISMLTGRIVNGIVQVILLSFTSVSYSFEIFITTSFVNAIPGIILQFFIIPFTVFTYEKIRGKKHEC